MKTAAASRGASVNVRPGDTPKSYMEHSYMTDGPPDWAIIGCYPYCEACKATETKRYKDALEEIAKMGRVCPEFETCNHPWCSDSCGAVLVALEALVPHSPRL